MQEAYESGLPVVRPMYLEFPEDKTAMNLTEQVSPIRILILSLILKNFYSLCLGMRC
jgi:hypothetical protein